MNTFREYVIDLPFIRFLIFPAIPAMKSVASELIISYAYSFDNGFPSKVFCKMSSRFISIVLFSISKIFLPTNEYFCPLLINNQRPRHYQHGYEMCPANRSCKFLLNNPSFAKILAIIGISWWESVLWGHTSLVQQVRDQIGIIVNVISG